MNISDLAITSLETINAFDVTTGDYLFTLDELQSASIANTQEKQDITGKGGRKLDSLKRNKSVTVSGNNGLVSGGLLELQTGSKFQTKDTDVMWTDFITVTDTLGDDTNRAHTTYKAVGTAGSEIAALYIRNADGTVSDPLTQVASEQLNAGEFYYNPTSKSVVVHNDDAPYGTELVAKYKRKINAAVLSNESDIYSGKATLYIDALAEDKCANVYRVQFFIPKADFNGDFTFDMGDNQSVHAFEAESLAGACGLGGMLWTYTVFGADAADAAGRHKNF